MTPVREHAGGACCGGQARPRRKRSRIVRRIRGGTRSGIAGTASSECLHRPFRGDCLLVFRWRFGGAARVALLRKVVRRMLVRRVSQAIPPATSAPNAGRPINQPTGRASLTDGADGAVPPTAARSDDDGGSEDATGSDPADEPIDGAAGSMASVLLWPSRDSASRPRNSRSMAVSVSRVAPAPLGCEGPLRTGRAALTASGSSRPHGRAFWISLGPS